MHPDILVELTHQRVAETRARACQARLARQARELTRSRRDAAKAARGSSGPRIPDYVDEMFGDTGQPPSRRAA